MVVVLVAIIVLVKFINGGGTSGIAVPDVVGKTKAQAEHTIISHQFKVGSETTQKSPTVPNGVVISQSPQFGNDAPKNTAINLVISSGKPQPKAGNVPNVVNETQAQAKQDLAKNGFHNVTVVPVASVAGTPADTVINESPDSGQLPPNTLITLSVTPTAANLVVPDVSGESMGQAQTTLSGQPWNYVTHVQTQVDGTVPANRVLFTSPGAGSQLAQGGTITITVAQAPPSPTPSPTSSSPSPSPTSPSTGP
ncbi:MAG: PASTA domain-containing protein [Actinobacteria bacterium]|nr:PASTA domain-containing protein [Actinomycetota bacterium]